MITIKLNEILCAIKNMQLDELHDIQSALEDENAIINIDVRGQLELSNVKVNNLEDIERHIPNIPTYTPPPTFPSYPMFPVPDPLNPLDPWHITAALNENTESATNRMPEVFVTPYSEQKQSEQMCHKLNISGYNGEAYFSTGTQDNYINDLFRK